MVSTGSLDDAESSMPGELEMRIHYDDRPPGALARGPIQTSDIERVRGDVAQAQERVAATAPAELAYSRTSGRRGLQDGAPAPWPRRGIWATLDFDAAGSRRGVVSSPE